MSLMKNEFVCSECHDVAGLDNETQNLVNHKDNIISVFFRSSVSLNLRGPVLRGLSSVLYYTPITRAPGLFMFNMYDPI